MNSIDQINETSYTLAKKKVERIKGFYRHLLVYLCVNIAITTTHVVSDMWNGQSFMTALWDLQTFFVWIPWGLGLFIHGLVALDVLSFFMGKNWEDKKIKELMEHDRKNGSMNWE